MSKLTNEEIAKIFETVPQVYKWAAMDKDGQWYAFMERPCKNEYIDLWHGGHYWKIDKNITSQLKVEWAESLVKRPEA